MIPGLRLRTLQHHKYTIKGFDILKMTSIYGANAAGKSNLVKAIALFKDIVVTEKLPFQLSELKFKFFNPNEENAQMLAVEFFQDGEPFYYAIEIKKGIVSTEELYLSGLGKSKDILIFERKTSEDEKTTLQFSNSFEQDEKSQLLKSVLIESLVKPNKPVLKQLAENSNRFLTHAKQAFQWFDSSLIVITPDSVPIGFVHQIDSDNNFRMFAENLLHSLNIGIRSLSSERKLLKDFLEEANIKDINNLYNRLESSKNKMIALGNSRGVKIVIVKEKDDLVIKQLKVEHVGKNNSAVIFDLNEESDGTIRLMEFIPAFQELMTKKKVIVIDEIERSIHPLLIKELIRKFSFEENTEGQLIFTTHESNLLDQEIFRQDEIWFAEKNTEGSTDLYSLSDFKEHNTIDIRKGYLNGRYGSIPFLANLHDLNWRINVTQ